MKEPLTWRTEKRRVKDLKLHEYNPRYMTKDQARQLQRSIEKFNLVEIPVIDHNNRVIAGNMRVQTLLKLGRGDEEIEVRVPSRPLTEEEVQEYCLRSNFITGSWDWNLLLNFDDKLLEDVGFAVEDLLIDFEETKEQEEQTPKRKRGQPLELYFTPAEADLLQKFLQKDPKNWNRLKEIIFKFVRENLE